MKFLSKPFIASALLAASTFVSAESESTTKMFSIGIASTAQVLGYDDYYGTEDEFAGFGFSGTIAPTDNVAFQANFYSLEHDMYDEIELSGVEIIAYFGTGLESEGFKAYIGPGYYSETVETPYTEYEASGLLLGAGIGYNWQYVALDLALAFKNADDYAEEFNVDTTSINAALKLSGRF
ncbi:hypothetical protein [Reinekea marinisedimentorum]|uniref:Outer membrane protein with beta-barrel domain n=1 Tax=Reinekea marinisedimentorum TaxID=230495 RepID=A0A4V2UJ59_9GAMM|nr:hypothetical protein [Reinekea marinisedimentorum]TCS38780.1 hypothetical protein BCF53_11554 [Reinekea marinisedimentorum]